MAKNTLLFLIILLAFVLRFWQLGVVPPGLFGDEVDTGYQAHSILKTGKDYFGNLFPVHFQSLGDWRVPLYIWLDTIFIAIFGLNEIAVRFPAAIFGVLGVLVTFFLAQLITKDDKIGLLSSFLLAISPWHIHFSRAAFEAILITFLFSLGLILFFKALKSKQMVYYGLAAFILGLTPYTYNTPKLFLPLIVVGILVLFKKEVPVQKKQLLVFILILGLVLLPQLADLFRGSGVARFGSVSIFNNPEVAERVRLARENCNYSYPLDRVLHNKVGFWVQDFIFNYLSAFSFDFLFLSGDPNPRHSVGSRGELYLFELPFLLIGLGVLVFKVLKKKNRLFGLILLWLVLAPIPAALTQGGGRHAIRLLLLLPFLQIATALGIVSAFSLIKKKNIRFLLAVLLGSIIFISLVLYLHQYFVHYPKTSGRWWNYGFKEVFEYVNGVEDRYDKIYITSSWEPSVVYTLFYSKYPSQKAQSELTISPYRLGKYWFLSPDIGRLARDEGDRKTLYVLNPAELEVHGLKLEEESTLRKIKDIFAPDGTKAFVIFSGSDVKER